MWWSENVKEQKMEILIKVYFPKLQTAPLILMNCYKTHDNIV